jgi:hypothetical protein
VAPAPHPAPAAGPVTMAAPFWVMTQNVQQLPQHPQPEVIEDVTITASQADLIGWQEIGLLRYKQAVAALPGFTTYWGIGKPSDKSEPVEKGKPYDSPISWRTEKFDFIEGGRFVVHQGKAKITDTRYCTWALLLDKASGVKFYHFNVHMVSSPFSTAPDVSQQALRQEMWKNGYATLDAQITKIVGDDSPLVLTGDFNATQNRDAEHFGKTIGGREMSFNTPPRSIDQIITTGGRWKATAPQTMPGRHSDHQGRRVHLALPKH